MSKKINIGVFVLLMCFISVSQAEWKSVSSKTGNWDTVDWDTPGPAGADDHAALIASYLDITNTKTVHDLSVGFVLDGSLNVLAPDGSLSVLYSFIVGHNGGIGTLNLYGPAYGWWIRIGNNEAGARGIVNVYSGGKLSSGSLGEGCGIGNDSGYGYVYLKGTGSMDVNSLVNDSWGDPVFIRETGHLDIEAGKLRVIGDQTFELSGYITGGKITAYGGTGTVNAPVLGTGEDEGWTVVTAEPAPATCVGDGAYLLSDLNFDCYIDIVDLAIFAQNWLKCNDPQNPTECN